VSAVGDVLDVTRQVLSYYKFEAKALNAMYDRAKLWLDKH
jgi:hypothetical protein